MNRNKHLTLEDRQIIAASLNENNSFKTIGMVLHKDCTTIAKEVKRNYTVVKSGCFSDMVTIIARIVLPVPEHTSAQTAKTTGVPVSAGFAVCAMRTVTAINRQSAKN